MTYRWPTLETLVVLLASIAAATVLLGSPPAARGVDAPVGAFSAARAMADVRGLTANDAPHPVGSRDHARVLAYVVARLRALGLDPVVQRARACNHAGHCADVQNVVAKIEGAEPGPSVMLAAHYDSVPAGPGAGDDAAGVATIFEVVRALRTGERPRHPVIVLIDDGEEIGLLGAIAFMDHHREAKNVDVVLNLEARGNAGPTAMFETSEGNAWLIARYAHAVTRPVASSVIYTLYKALPNDTDLTVFKARGAQGLNFAFADRVSEYHTARDSGDRLDPRSVQHMGDQVLAVTRALVEGELVPAGGGNAIYFDLFSLVLVSFPQGWAGAAAGTGCAFAIIGIFMAAFRAGARIRGVLLGVVATILSLAAAAATGVGITATVAAMAGRARPWSEAPLPTWIALVSGGTAAATAVGLATTRHVPPISIWGGVLAVWGGVAVWVTRVAPGASYLFSIPLIAHALGLIAAGAHEPGEPVGPAAPLFGVVVAAVLWFPLLRILLIMVGADVDFATTTSVAAVATLALPLLAALQGSGRWVVPVAAAMGAVGAVCLATFR